MKAAIIYRLTAIEQEYQVTVLMASEAGSRAWGFSSPDSDYDVRFVYRQPLNHYLSLFRKQDVIELGVDGLLDVGGWDIDKALRLLGKSNVPLMEWLHSPLIYRADAVFLGRAQALATEHFVPAAGFHHYQSMAKKYTELCQGATCKLKHLFYALRTTLAARWIVRYQTFPPVRFTEIVDGLSIDSSVREEMVALQALKRDKPESYQHPARGELVAFLTQLVSENEGQGSQLRVPRKDLTSLNTFFRTLVIPDQR